MKGAFMRWPFARAAPAGSTTLRPSHSRANAAPIRTGGSLLAAAASLGLLAATAAAATPLEGPALWIARPPAAVAPQQLVAEASAAGARTVFVKAAEGSTPEPGFTPALLETFKAAGIRLCAWTFVYGLSPDGEAAAAIDAVHAGAPCLVVDAEGQYDSRYASAQRFVHDLRAALGARFPIALAGQAEVLAHPKFPYSVFLAPGAFDVDMPQLYWRELGLSVTGAFTAAIGQNLWYGRPVAPVGQLFDDATAAEVAQFERAAASRGERGFSLFDLEALSPLLAVTGLATSPATGHLRVVLPTLHAGSDGDEVVWAQEHLNGTGAHLPVGGFFGAQTAAAVARFQRKHHLRGSGALDDRTWRLLLRVRPRTPSWTSAPPVSAR
jgi:hypothetical protein